MKEAAVRPDERFTQRQRTTVLSLGAACAAVLILLLVLLFWPAGQKTSFVPPAFETAAQVGVPEAPEELGWSQLEIAEGYTIHICGVLRPDEAGNLPVWFTTDPENKVWVKLRVLDDQGHRLGETGVLRPGEYVESLHLESLPEQNQDVVLKVIGYEPETYYSAGNAAIQNVLELS